MLSRLTPCSRCQRHVRINEASCPFCGVERASLRAHATAILTGVALLAGCGAPEEKPKPTSSLVKPDPQPVDSKPVVEEPDVPREMYGAPPPPEEKPIATSTPTSMAIDPKEPTKPVVEKKPKPVVEDKPEPQRKLYGAPPPRNPKDDPLKPF